MLPPMKSKQNSARINAQAPRDPWMHYNVHDDLFASEDSQEKASELLSRNELLALTGTMQPKRMCQWLELRGWAFEPPARRGDTPKVLRAYRDARLTGTRTERSKRADYSFMTVARI